MVTYNVVRMGAGMGAPMLVPDSIEKKLDHIINNASYKENALKFAERHKDFKDDDMINSMLETVNKLLG